MHTVPNTQVDRVCYLILLRSDPGGGGRQLTYLLLTTITGIPPSHRSRLISPYTSHPSVHTRPLFLAPTLTTEQAPARPSSECLAVGYGSAAGWRCFPSHRHRILLLTSYFLLLTLHLDIKAKRARAGEVSRAHTPADEPDPTGPWGSSVRELRPAIRPWGCEHSWHPLGYISIWPV